MANIGKWSLSTVGITTVLSDTQLSALASATMSAAGSTYDNSTNLDLYVDLEVNLPSMASTPGGGAYVTIYVYVSEDGSNFPAQSAADLRLTTTQLLCSIPVGTGSSTQRVVARMIPIPPKKIQFLLDNQTGAALGTSQGST